MTQHRQQVADTNRQLADASSGVIARSRVAPRSPCPDSDRERSGMSTIGTPAIIAADERARREDARISLDVRARLVEGGTVHHLELEVACRHGVVVLRGRVRTYYAKQIAQEQAKQVDCVRRIRNELNVRHGETR